ncbi:TadE/TadG family type IV pilus assembly protein [Leptospira interrogans]
MTKLRRFVRNTEGAYLVEFAVSAPLFFLLMFFMIQSALMLWALVGLQHGAEAAARCASVSDLAIVQGKQNPPTPCYAVNGNATANMATVKTYAAANSFGFNPPASTFTVSFNAGSCPNGNLVTASYPFTAIRYMGSVTITVSSCYPSVAT